MRNDLAGNIKIKIWRKTVWRELSIRSRLNNLAGRWGIRIFVPVTWALFTKIWRTSCFGKTCCQHVGNICSQAFGGDLLKPGNPYVLAGHHLTNQPVTDEMKNHRDMARRHLHATKNLLEVWQNKPSSMVGRSAVPSNRWRLECLFIDKGVAINS